MKVLIKPTSTSKRAGYKVIYIAPFQNENHDYRNALCKDVYKNFFVIPMRDIIFTKGFKD